MDTSNVIYSVSTHAHARWTTLSVLLGMKRRTSFNPRPRTVGDVYIRNVMIDPEMFQPTPTHGGRHKDAELHQNSGGVSTHAHARWATQKVMYESEIARVSTHAHARWATVRAGDIHMDDRGFNPRPRTVGDVLTNNPTGSDFLFQPTPTHGGRLDELENNPFFDECFNPRPRTVGDRRTSRVSVRERRFNPRPRTVGD